MLGRRGGAGRRRRLGLALRSGRRGPLRGQAARQEPRRRGAPAGPGGAAARGRALGRSAQFELAQRRAARAAAKRSPSSAASGRSLASTARSWKNGTSRCQGVTTFSEARSQAEQTTAMPTRSRATRGEADLRREERLAATLLRAPEQPRPISAAHATRGSLAELLAGIPGDAAGQRFPERLARRRADDRRVVEFLVRQQGIVRATAAGALVLHAVDGRMLCARKAHDAHEMRERDPVSPLRRRGRARGSACGTRLGTDRTLIQDTPGIG